VLCEGFSGCLGEVVDRSAGGVELHDQCPGLCAEGGFHPCWLTQLLAAEDAVEQVGAGVDVALSARFEQQLTQPGLG